MRPVQNKACGRHGSQILGNHQPGQLWGRCRDGSKGDRPEHSSVSTDELCMSSLGKILSIKGGRSQVGVGWRVCVLYFSEPWLNLVRDSSTEL